MDDALNTAVYGPSQDGEPVTPTQVHICCWLGQINLTQHGCRTSAPCRRSGVCCCVCASMR